MNIYKQSFSLGLQKAMRYRFNFYVGMLSIIFPMCIQYFLWTSVFSSGKQEIYFGYTLSQMLSYAAFAILTGRIIFGGFIYEVNGDIKSGGLAKYLVRPMRYMPYQATCYLGEKFVTILLSSILIVIASVIFNANWTNTIKIQNIVMYFLILVLSVILNFVLYFAICGAGFWMRDASGAIFIITVIANIVSGGVFPLDIFSGKIQFILKLFPFSYTNYFPVSVLCGRTVGNDIYYGIIMQISWILIIVLIQQMVWKKGVKRYTAVGG